MEKLNAVLEYVKVITNKQDHFEKALSSFSEKLDNFGKTQTTFADKLDNFGETQTVLADKLVRVENNHEKFAVNQAQIMVGQNRFDEKLDNLTTETRSQFKYIQAQLDQQ